MDGTSDEGDFTMDMTLNDVLTLNSYLSGTMTAEIVETGETATVTFDDMTLNSSGVVNGGTIAATYADYTINLTYASDGTTTGNIELNGTEIATLSIDPNGTSTMTYDGKTYDLATGKPVDAIF